MKRRENQYNSWANQPIWSAGLRSRSRKESDVFGWSRSRIPNNTGSRSRICLSDSNSGCPIGSYFTSHSKIGNSWWNGAISFETFAETEISCCVPRFPLILIANFHSLYVKESESDILPPTLPPCWSVNSRWFECTYFQLHVGEVEGFCYLW